VIRPDSTVAFFDTPIDKIKVGKSARAVYNQTAMLKLLKTIKEVYADSTDLTVVIEEVHAMPKTGSQGNFGSGFGYGLWQGLLTALQIPFVTVQPGKWKKALGLKKPDGDVTDSVKKNADRLFACQIFPQSADDMNLVKHHGRADALLIAEFGRRSVA
jgi:hypothetical protein